MVVTKTCRRQHSYDATQYRQCPDCAKAAWQARAKRNPEEYRERSAKWREANRERHYELNLLWRENNKERFKALQTKWEAANPERRKELSRAWKLKNAEHVAAYQLQWSRKNPDKVAIVGHRRRALKLAATVEPFDVEQWFDVVRFYDGLCAYCETAPSTDMEHVVPLSKGGAHAIRNLVPSCETCNCKKYTDTWEPLRRHPFMVVAETEAATW